MPTISIKVDNDILKELERRAKKEYLTIKELIEDIIRRSAITSKARKTGSIPKVQAGKFIEYFSRYQPYKRRKKKTLKTKKHK
ncbi:MAG: hypothetical protein KJ767_00130 [Nanoarchaeota archaeon]|nr:hypothetical protein [Nanoarchaeota archaeon]